MREGLEPIFHLRGRKRTQIGEFLIDGCALGGEFVIVVDDFAQQAGQKAERQLPQRLQVGNGQAPRLGWIPCELLGFEIALEACDYTNSLIGLPWESAGRKSHHRSQRGHEINRLHGMVIDHALAHARAQSQHPGGA